MARAIGIDGCPGGWFVVSIHANGFHVKLVTDLAAYLGACRGSDQVWIDMPIGFPVDDVRECESAARKYLGWPRSSSVFPVPVRDVIAHAQNYAQASTIQRRTIGRGLTKQCWNIVPKMRELDHVMRNARGGVRESHPEVVFAALNRRRFPTTTTGSGLVASKTKGEGRTQRLSILRDWSTQIDAIYNEAKATHRRKDLGLDDIIDALGLAIAARLVQTGRATLITLPATPSADVHGRPMEIVYAEPKPQ